MSNWLLSLVWVLGSLCGAVFTMYSPISVGSNEMSSMATSLQNISRVINTYYNRLNNAHNKVIPEISKLQSYFHTTYMALNDSYGASQSNIVYFWRIQGPAFNTTLSLVDRRVVRNVRQDLNELQSQLQQSINYIVTVTNMGTNSRMTGENGDSCSAQFADVSSNIPARLTLFGQCLQTNIDVVPTLATSLKTHFTIVLNDLKSLNKHLKICATSSDNCISEYFESIFRELYVIRNAVEIINSRLRKYENYIMLKNQVCGKLARGNVLDATQNLQQQVSQCMYPQTMD